MKFSLLAALEFVKMYTIFWWNFHYLLHWNLSKCIQYFNGIFITGCTGSCQYDNFQCSQWWKYHQNSFCFSVILVMGEHYGRHLPWTTRMNSAIMLWWLPRSYLKWAQCFTGCYQTATWWKWAIQSLFSPFIFWIHFGSMDIYWWLNAKDM